MTGSIQGAGVNFLIDTGATLTILSRKIYDSLTDDQKPELILDSEEILMADDSPLSVLGKGLMKITIGTKQVTQEIWVADL